MKNRKTKRHTIIMNSQPYKDRQLTLNKLTIKQLKEICKDMKLKRTGRKVDIVDRICMRELENNAVIVIQKYLRGYLVRKYMSYKGNPSNFVNDEDFLTFDDWNTTSFHQRFCYTDSKNFCYAFDVVSLCTLFSKQPKNERNVKPVLNPYNREAFPKHLKKTLYRMIRIGKLLGYVIQTTCEEEAPKKLGIRARVSNVFMEMDRLGNYTDTSWLTHLDRALMIRFIHELHDIWQYRASLTNSTRQQICHPHGNPFRGINLHSLRQYDFNKIRHIVVDIIEAMVYKSINDEFKALGVMYILTALTLVSRDAATALPWLYESAIQS